MSCGVTEDVFFNRNDNPTLIHEYVALCGYERFTSGILTDFGNETATEEGIL